MSRYIDADALIKIGLQDGAYEYVSVDEIANFPTADVVEVVRCKDCKLFEQNGKKEFGNCPHHQCLAYLTDFCSWGERREDAEIH